jgi:hypothetical protein
MACAISWIHNRVTSRRKTDSARSCVTSTVLGINALKLAFTSETICESKPHAPGKQEADEADCCLSLRCYPFSLFLWEGGVKKTRTGRNGRRRHTLFRLLQNILRSLHHHHLLHHNLPSAKGKSEMKIFEASTVTKVREGREVI